MGPIKVRQIERALLDKGMERAEGAHHKMFSKVYPGGPTLMTRISHGADEYPDFLLSAMAKQLALRNNEVRELVTCTLSAHGWDALVAERCPDGVNPMATFRRSR